MGPYITRHQHLSPFINQSIYLYSAKSKKRCLKVLCPIRGPQTKEGVTVAKKNSQVGTNLEHQVYPTFIYSYPSSTVSVNGLEPSEMPGDQRTACQVQTVSSVVLENSMIGQNMLVHRGNSLANLEQRPF